MNGLPTPRLDRDTERPPGADSLAAAPARGCAALRIWALAALTACGASVSAADAERWSVVGQQGLVRLVIVPAALVKDRHAYERQIAGLCEPERTCFLNFYANSTGAVPAVPLPDAIANEATATYRRSVKNGAQVFTWSCRLKIPGEACF